MASSMTSTNQFGANVDYTIQQPTSVVFFIDHPRVTKDIPKNSRKILRTYDQYVKQILSGSIQLAVVDSTPTEPVHLINLRYRVNSK